MASMLDEVLENRLKVAHGVLAACAWVVFFPAGAISIRLWHNRFTLWLHGITQILAYALYITAVCIGIVVTQMLIVVEPTLWTNYHVLIGLIIFGLAFLNPLLGFAHHFYKGEKQVNNRTIWAQAHIWLGRILITAGMINGGLGLYISEGYQPNIPKGEIVYGVFAGVIWIVYVAAAVFGEIWKKVGTDVRAKDVIPVMKQGGVTPPRGEEKMSPSDSDSDQVSRGGSHNYQTYYDDSFKGGYGDEKPFKGRGSGSMRKAVEQV